MDLSIHYNIERTLGINRFDLIPKIVEVLGLKQYRIIEENESLVKFDNKEVIIQSRHSIFNKLTKGEFYIQSFENIVIVKLKYQISYFPEIILAFVIAYGAFTTYYWISFCLLFVVWNLKRKINVNKEEAELLIQKISEKVYL